MTRISFLCLAFLMMSACGGSAPPAEEPTSEAQPEPVEVVEDDAEPESTEPAAAEGEAGAQESAAPEASEAEAEPASEEAAAPAEEPLPSSDLQAYVNATTGYTPEFRTVMDNMDTFKQCYLDAMRANPDLAGTLKVKFTVLKTGKVKKASAVINELNDEVANCVLKALKKLKFPKRADKRTVEYPFKFIPSPS